VQLYESKDLNVKENIIYVKIADLKIAYSPYKLKTVLGSCVGVCLYDEEEKIGGLVHVMLPRGNVLFKIIHKNDLKFADTGVITLIKELKYRGGNLERFKAKIFGGAKIYFSKNNKIFPDIGKENVKVVRKILKEHNIKVVAEDVLGTKGRTIIFNLKNGLVSCKRFMEKEVIY